MVINEIGATGGGLINKQVLIKHFVMSHGLNQLCIFNIDDVVTTLLIHGGARGKCRRNCCRDLRKV